MNKTLTMYTRLTLVYIAVFCFSFSLSAQNNRTIEGTGNNLTNPDWGGAHKVMPRMVPAEYGDGISSPTGSTRPNPRVISNLLFDQNSPINDPLHLSDFVWVFGQFIDHDVVLVANDPTEDASIHVNFPDVYFNPGGALPFVYIPMHRSMGAPGTGVDVSNPREHMNSISSWIDGSGVYGSDMERANWLRTFSEGKLKTSTGNLLPYNTTTGEYGDPVDATAPFMADDVGMASRLFVAGDIRANEQPLLTVFHTLFVREHNRQCDEILTLHPTWSDEEIYQYARKMVGGLIQSITYEEWLPAMGLHLPPYTNYDETINGSISNIFSAAAFRIGHTLLNSNILRLDSNGEVIPQGNLTLQQAFFNPDIIADAGGLDPYLKGMATQVEQDLDSKVISDVRNFLFGPPGAGGLDLASININRGRERGLPDFNQVRQDLGLSVYPTFEDINPDSTVFSALQNVYGDVNEIDPWVGMLAEDHMPGALFGETVMEIMTRQFKELRDGDRFYYENDPVLSPADKDAIKNTTMRMVLMRNTGIELMQENVFTAMPHDSICGAAGNLVTIGGVIQTQSNAPVGNVDVEIVDIYNSATSMATATDGLYSFADLNTCSYYHVTPERNDNHRNGISVLDIILIGRHLVGLESFNSPYKFIAADVDNNGQVSSFDIIEIQKLILLYFNEFPSNSSWRFIDADYVFNDPQHPLVEDFPESRLVDMLTANEVFNFVGVKVGDINGSANPSVSGNPAEDRNLPETIVLQAEEQEFAAGELITVALKNTEWTTLAGFQFALDFDAQGLEFVGLEGLKETNYAVFPEEGRLAMIGENLSGTIQPIELTFRSRNAGKLSEMLTLTSSKIVAEAYDQNLQAKNIALEIVNGTTPVAAFQLLQNQPNPFVSTTTIRFNLPYADNGKLSIVGMNGQVVKVMEGVFAKGYNEIDLGSDLFPAAGVYYYQLETSLGSQTRKMILISSEDR